MKTRLNKILTKGKAFYLAYDQGLEHGPVEFNEKNVNPLDIIKIAKDGGYNGIIFQKGIAEKYNKEIKRSKVPLILKLNGKTSLGRGEPISRQICSVKEAIALGAKAVGYTIYLGSAYESIMMHEFSEIEEEAHKKGMPVIAWIYPRGQGTKEKTENELMEYAARAGLEIGADIIKIKYSGSQKALRFAVKAAGKCKVVIAGGVKENESAFLKQCREVMKAGAIGLAIGRNVWQARHPDKISRKARKIVFGR